MIFNSLFKKAADSTSSSQKTVDKPPKNRLPQSEVLTVAQVYNCLSQVMDPELNIDIVSLGLVYDVKITELNQQEHFTTGWFVYIKLTLTTPGCPLASVFDPMIRESLEGLPGLDVYEQVQIELTFDPPWVPDMMSEEARATLDI